MLCSSQELLPCEMPQVYPSAMRGAACHKIQEPRCFIKIITGQVCFLEAAEISVYALVASLLESHWSHHGGRSCDPAVYEAGSSGGTEPTCSLSSMVSVTGQ